MNFAGHSGAWLLYQVSQHPEVEAKICAELEEHGLLVTSSRPQPRKVTYEDLGKLTYLDMVIKVSLDSSEGRGLVTLMGHPPVKDRASLH